MAVEIQITGYQSIRDFIQANWTWIELRAEGGSSILRLSTADSRVSWVHSPGSQKLQLQVHITGSDGDITLPTTIACSAIYDVGSGGSAYSVANIALTTLESPEDELYLTHEIQVPEAV